MDLRCVCCLRFTLMLKLRRDARRMNFRSHQIGYDDCNENGKSCFMIHLLNLKGRSVEEAPTTTSSQQPQMR